MRKPCLLLALSLLSAAERKVDPTFLHRFVPAVREVSRTSSVGMYRRISSR